MLYWPTRRQVPGRLSTPALAEAARDRGARVTLISTVGLPVPSGVELVAVERAEEMRDAVLGCLPDLQALVMAAAVADYRPAAEAEQKIKRLYEQLRSGTDFATLAAQASEDPNTAVRSGDVGFRTEEQMRQMFPTRPELVGRLMGMTAGQSTEPIQDNASKAWYIIKVNSKVEQARNLSLDDVRANITNAITQQRQGILLNALVANVVNESGVKNYLAERIVQNPQIISEMKPSELLNQSKPQQQPQQPQPRFENQNRAPANANRPAANTNAGAASRPMQAVRRIARQVHAGRHQVAGQADELLQELRRRRGSQVGAMVRRAQEDNALHFGLALEEEDRLKLRRAHQMK